MRKRKYNRVIDSILKINGDQFETRPLKDQLQLHNPVTAIQKLTQAVKEFKSQELYAVSHLVHHVQ